MMSSENKESIVEVKVVKGYKVFNPDWTCKGFKYEVGKSYEMNGDIECCNRGFHFCTKLIDCFKYYSFNPSNKVAEVEAYGKIDYNKEDTKACTNKIRIVREIPWDEVLSMADIIASNTGTNNTGIYNIGDRNTGHHNIGDYNIGDRNTGDCNTGGYNTGDCNAGISNTGDCNTGNNNTGNYNVGSFNSTNYSSGWLCTEEPKVTLFNKPTDMTYREWESTRAYEVLYYLPCAVDGGQRVYDNLSDEDKNVIKSLPNFDADIFKQCTGIDVGIDK